MTFVARVDPSGRSTLCLPDLNFLVSVRGDVSPVQRFSKELEKNRARRPTQKKIESGRRRTRNAAQKFWFRRWSTTPLCYTTTYPFRVRHPLFTYITQNGSHRSDLRLRRPPQDQPGKYFPSTCGLAEYQPLQRREASSAAISGSLLYLA